MEQTFVWAGAIIASFGYLGLEVALFFNCLGLPVASEVILPLAGIAVNQGSFEIVPTFMAVMGAQMLGFSLAYLIARHAGVGLIEKYGNYLLISHKQVVRGQRLFRKHGSIIMLVGLITPGMHGYMGYSAGLAKMRVTTFLIVGVTGTAIWSAALIGLGYLFGDKLPQILDFGNRAGLATGIIVASCALYFWYSRHRRLKTRPSRHSSRRGAPAAAKLR